MGQRRLKDIIYGEIIDLHTWGRGIPVPSKYIVSAYIWIGIFTEEDDWNVVFDECSPLASMWQQLSAYLGLKLIDYRSYNKGFPWQ